MLDLGAGCAQHSQFLVHLHQRFVVAVPVHQQLSAGSLRRRIAGRVEHEKFAEQEDLLAQPLRSLVVGEETSQLITKDTGAARLENDDGNAGLDFRSQRVHHLLQVSARLLQKSKVVQRASAGKGGLSVPAR